MAVNWSAEALTNTELADEIVARVLDPDEYDHWASIEVAREVARRLRVDHGALHRDSQEVPLKFRES